MALITKNVESGHSIPVMWNRPRGVGHGRCAVGHARCEHVGRDSCQRLSAPFRADYAVELGSDFQRVGSESLISPRIAAGMS